jgi:hypothetical protein
MQLITSDEQLRMLIPHVFATVEGEPSLFEILYPFLDTAEQWAIDTFVSEDVFPQLTETEVASLTKLVAYHAYMSAVPSLDLVLTPNGFGIVSNTNVIPASKERIERLLVSLETERDRNINQLILRLSARSEWRQSQQGKYFASTIFPFLSLCHRLAIREHIWENYQKLHNRLIKIEAVLAYTYFSHEQMSVFRDHVITQLRTAKPLEEQVIRTLQSLEMMLVSDMQVHPQSFYDLVNIIREHEEIFPAWHSSPVASLYTPKVFENKKKSSGYWF